MATVTEVVQDGDPNPKSTFFYKLKVAILSVSSFPISIALLSLTKWVYVVHDYKFPLFLTVGHMIVSYLMSAFIIFVMNMVPNRRIITFREQVMVVAPFSVMGAASIACGNMALVFLYPSFHEMLQNTSAFWTLICSIIFAGRRYNFVSYLTMIPITCGGAICAYGEVSDFRIIGVVISIGAAVFRALRIIVQSALMRGRDPIDSITLLFYSAPFNICLFLLASLCIEGIDPWVKIWDVPMGGIGCILLSCLMAALFNLFAFLMVGHMTAVCYMIVGNIKTPTIILTSCIIFGNPCTLWQVAGFATVMTGASLYNKYSIETSIVPDPGIYSGVKELGDDEEMINVVEKEEQV